MNRTPLYFAIALLAAGSAALPIVADAADKEAGKPNPVAAATAKAIGKIRADNDMQAVLKAHASLNPKAIEKVDVATARANPTIADAVNVVLKQQGKSTKPEDLVPGVTAKDASVQGAAGMLLDTESYIENALAKPLNRAMVKWFVDKLVRSPADLKDTRLQLIDAKLAGMAAGVTIINARIDPLRSDGAKMEDALKKANVPVERRDYEGVTHEFFGTAAVVDKARQAQEYAGQRLKQAFGAS